MITDYGPLLLPILEFWGRESSTPPATKGNILKGKSNTDGGDAFRKSGRGGSSQKVRTRVLSLGIPHVAVNIRLVLSWSSEKVRQDCLRSVPDIPSDE